MPLTFDEYSRRTAAQAIYPRIRIILDDGEPIEAPWLYPLLGLCGEVGELTEKYKKLLRDDRGVMTPERAAAIQKERGDPMWYLPRLAEAAGTTMEADAQANLNKCDARVALNKQRGDGDDRENQT